MLQKEALIEMVEKEAMKESLQVILMKLWVGNMVEKKRDLLLEELQGRIVNNTAKGPLGSGAKGGDT